MAILADFKAVIVEFFIKQQFHNKTRHLLVGALAFLLNHTDVATALPNALPNVIPAKAGIHSLTAKTHVT